MSAVQIASVRYQHDGMIDEILLNPAMSQGELAKRFGYSQTWISIVVNSDAFKERLAERKGELMDPIIRASIQEKADAAANRALDRLMERLDNEATCRTVKTADLIGVAKLAVTPKTLAPPPVAPNLYVFQLPAQAQNSQEWVRNVSGNTPGGLPLVVENTPGV